MVKNTNPVQEKSYAFAIRIRFGWNTSSDGCHPELVEGSRLAPSDSPLRPARDVSASAHYASAQHDQWLVTQMSKAQ